MLFVEDVLRTAQKILALSVANYVIDGITINVKKEKAVAIHLIIPILIVKNVRPHFCRFLKLMTLIFSGHCTVMAPSLVKDVIGIALTHG